MNTIRLFLCILMASAVWSLPGWTQPDSNFITKITVMKKKKLIESLDLSKEKTEAFVKIYDEYTGEQWRLNKEKKALFQRLVHITALGNDVADEKITQTIDDLDAVEHKILAQRQSALDKMKGILTTPQVARFIVFEQNFQFKLRQMWFDVQYRKSKMRKFMPPREDEDMD
jgi:hypothetical protein